MTQIIDADVLRLFISKASFLAGSKRRQTGFDKTLKQMYLHNDVDDTIAMTWSDDTKQVLLAGTQTITGVKSFTGKITSTNEIEQLLSTINASAAQTKALQFKTAGTIRGRLEMVDAESGSNAGANVYLRTYTDAGALLATIFKVTRSTSIMEFYKTILLKASEAGFSSLRIPHGVAPSAPVNGDVWTDTSGIYVRINGVTQSLVKTGSFTATLTGVGGTVTGTVNYTILGDSVIMTMPELKGLNNAVTVTITGMPSAIHPPAVLRFYRAGVVSGNLAELRAEIGTGGIITLANGLTAGTASFPNDNLNCGLEATAFSYNLKT